MNLFIKGNYGRIEEGIIKIAHLGKHLKHIGFDLLRLKKGNHIDFKNENVETAVVLFKGKFSLIIEGEKFDDIPGRDNVFQEEASAAYIPLNTKFRIIAKQNMEAAICYGKASKTHKPFIIKPQDVRIKEVGKENYFRYVKDIIYDKHQVDNLKIGETVSFDGNWSSFPPHKHDRDRPPIESKLEEIFLFRIEPPKGFAVQKVYTEERDIDETYTMHDYDSVLIPRGYHPVVGFPGYKILYFWILGGEKRYWKVFEDENHSWIGK